MSTPDDHRLVPPSPPGQAFPPAPAVPPAPAHPYGAPRWDQPPAGHFVVLEL